MDLDTDVLILGAGMSGLNFAIRLQQTYPSASYTIIESTSDLGGTWSVNTYPGCGCDVASHLYSYSFALKPDWSQKFALQREILDYFRDVAKRHDVVHHIEFESSVKKAVWDETYGVWVSDVLDRKTGTIRKVRSRVVVSAVGALSIPRECEIEGAETFRGAMFHSARWDHEFDWGGKEVVVIGNGCSATQFVPILSNGSTTKNYITKRSPVKKVTQFARQPHWLAERPNPVYSPLFKWTMCYIPLVMRMYRLWLYADMEKDFFGFNLSKGVKIRQNLTNERLEYMKRTAPEKYHSALTPTTEIGCKRKVNDTDYFSCLHNDNMELVWDDPVVAVTETGVRTKSGREVRADAIILANGFQTQKVLYPLNTEIRGEGGVSLDDHWQQVSNGHPQAYYGTCISSFPNFFVMMGPNTTTGHLSVIYSTECQVNFSLRVLKPILRRPSVLSLRAPSAKPTSVAVTLAAEEKDNTWIQTLSKNLVWSSGCTSWYIDAKTGRNTMLYPDWQFNFWLRSIFVPVKRDFVYKQSPKDVASAQKGGKKIQRLGLQLLWNSAVLASVVGVVGLGAGIARGDIKVDEVDELWKRVSSEFRGVSEEVFRILTAKV
ncbi:dimethylaniline monooxygenase, putative [Talaromyces stipitatus ATCC 10500]|uniref:Dimethylaniline monooxygenase, putative n=1 Tax=Talaromyces stipitatus (strain ATCC 10500 / CBS 375.48 / QM 6759 / NRRL 1006) TaxID=441959 RepID=B8MEU6_TALSN|nr:dimethylaniline monooxygenase, putative [Talaromyces stipitatus ATCC 10500]EED16979.1 dimethylaniline monooxygenase, putative [Talaromyces stipitatus ATCC 10500]